MMKDLEDALNRMSREGWNIVVYSDKLPMNRNSFLLVARHPRFKELPMNLTLVEAEKRTIMAALALNDDKFDKTAKRLGISKTTLYRKVEEYKIPVKKREKKKITQGD